MPSADLQFPDSAGLFSERPGFENDDSVKPYIREADGTLKDDSVRRTASQRSSYSTELGPLKDIVSRREICPLCKFIATMFKKSHKREESSLPAGPSWQGVCSILLSEYQFGTVNDHSDSLPYKIHFWGGWEIHSFHFSCWSKDEFEKHEAFLAAPSSAPAGEPTLLGRYRPGQCDVSLFKSWLQICTEGHQKCTQDPISGTSFLRLIDVTNMCLVTVNSDELPSAKYLALSYVWGGGPKDFILTKANLQDYCRHHGLPPLPATIADAIELTRRLGQEHIWIDSLCIISDDAQDKAVQIPAMTSIYGCALLTIIAAAGQNADHGLPGLRIPRPEKEVVDIGCYQIVQSHTPATPSYGRPIAETKWASRAWTFQELLLSRRSLIFLDNHVEWHCGCAEWFEEHNFEHADLSFSWGSIMSNPKATLDVYNYKNLIVEYTKRELTFESDILDAFSGIMEAIPDEFFWGIPYSAFGEYLTWTVYRPPWDDGRSVDQRRDCGLKIPSWSWFSWKGIITLANDMKPTQSLLSVYRWQDGNLKQICTPKVVSLPDRYGTNDDDQRDQTIWRNETEWTVSLDDIPKDVVLNENQLIFWGFVIGCPIPEVGERVLVGHNGMYFVHVLRITWRNNIATRVARETFRENEWPIESAVKNLIIME